MTTSNPRAARIAVSALFLTNGAIFANLLPRYPQIKADLGLGNAEFGLAVATFPTGAIIAGLAAAALIRRYRSSRVAVAGTLLTSAGMLGAAISPSWLALASSLFFAGAMDAITDVAQNSHGLRVQRLYGRSIINSFHAIWSIGAVLGGLMGGLAVGLEMPGGLHLGLSAMIFGIVALVALRYTLPGPEPLEAEHAEGGANAARRAPLRDCETISPAQPKAERSQGRALLARSASEEMGSPQAGPISSHALKHVHLALGVLVLIAIGGTLTEDAANTWAALYISGTLGADVAIASSGFVAFVGAQFVGRLLGDGFVDRLGQRTVARAGGALSAVGMGAALLFPSVAGTIAGFACAGFGVATLVPAAMHGADELPGLRAGTGLTILSWLMRLGFLLSPPLVGLVADAVGLRVGLLVVPLAGALVVALAGVLSNERVTIAR